MELDGKDGRQTLTLPNMNVKGSQLSSGNRSTVSKIADLANHAHQIISRQYLKCGCPNSPSHHKAKLRLEMPRAPSQFPLKETQFDVLFSTSEEAAWKEGEVQISVAKTTPNHNSVATHRSAIRPTKGVQFKEAQPSTSSLEGSTQKKVEDICHEIHSVVQARLRFLVRNNELWMLRTVRLQVQGLKYGTFVTLNDLIRGDTFRSLPQQEKYRLAFLIADSIVHLYSGRWLQTLWNNECISFLASTDGQAGINTKEPYLSTQFVEPFICKPDLRVIHPDQTILTLGIVLLKIATGVSLESRREGAQHPNTDLATAEDMLKELRENTASYIPDHILAIETCLQPEQIFERYRSSVEDIRWCLFENIVEPLRRIIDGSESIGDRAKRTSKTQAVNDAAPDIAPMDRNQKGAAIPVPMKASTVGVHLTPGTTVSYKSR